MLGYGLKVRKNNLGCKVESALKRVETGQIQLILLIMDQFQFEFLVTWNYQGLYRYIVALLL